ncbi:MAG: hypothetical protein MUF25_20140, partial [Pirellulaceae bacterium]|nr:hypothetical protein [Pirellulaceae bacterium]
MKKKVVFALSIAFTLSLMVVALMAQPSDAPPGKGDDPRTGRKVPPPPPSRQVEAVDANHDGELSAEEIAGASQAFLKLDKNGDGKLDREELRPRGPGGAALYGQPDLSAGVARFDASPLPKDDDEKKIHDALADMARHRKPDAANVPPGDGRILRLLAESLG